MIKSKFFNCTRVLNVRLEIHRCRASITLKKRKKLLNISKPLEGLYYTTYIYRKNTFSRSWSYDAASFDSGTLR